MPAAEQFSPHFVRSFVLECHAQGLTKEATINLLEVAVLKAAHDNPAFAEGFAHRAAVEGLDKSAWALAGKALAGVAGLGAVGYGANKAYDAAHNFNRNSWSDVPSAGGYNPEAAKAVEKARLAERSGGVSYLNEQADYVGKRRAELQGVVNSGGPGMASAGTELQGLRRSPFEGQRAKTLQELSAYGQTNADNLRTVQDDLKSLDDSRNSWWHKARKFVGLGHDFEADERRLWGQKDTLSSRDRLNSEMLRRLEGGYTGGDAAEAEPTQTLQQRFFRTQ